MTDKQEYPLGLTRPEWENLLQTVKYGAIIVLTVLITFTIVAGITRLIDYDPPSPSAVVTDTPTLPSTED